MNYVVLDTETTGLHVASDRVIEIGAVRIRDRMITEERFHCYLNPGCPVHPDAVSVHGLTNAFLKDKPSFEEVAHSLVDWLAGSVLVIHNAPFDVGFLNMELQRAGHLTLDQHVTEVLDTLVLARRLHRGKKNDLDSLLSRYRIDASERTHHGALIDAILLARVYLKMTHRQQAINFDAHLIEDKAEVSISVSDLDRGVLPVSFDWLMGEGH